MRLVIAAEIFPPDIGGPATYSKKLAEELEKRSWLVKLICYSNEPGNGEVIRVLRGQNTLFRYLRYFWNLLKISQDADVIYAQGPVSSGLPAVLVGKILRKKVVVKVVGDYAWEQARNFGFTNLDVDSFQKKSPTGKIGNLKKIETWVCKQSDKVIVPSNYLKKIVMGWGISEDKIEVIYNSSNIIISPDKNNFDPYLIVSAGRLVPWKGFKILIEAMADIIKENEKFKLLICGSGPEEENLKKLVGRLDVGPNIMFAGMVEQSKLWQKLCCCAFVLNSGYEGLSHTILEAMAVGTPVIASNVGGNPELITHGHNGLLIEYDNKDQIKKAILTLHNNEELRKRFIENSKKVLEKFSYENMINQTINILKSY